MYYFIFFALLAVFLTVLPSGIDLLGIRMKVDRNYRQERIPVGQPTGEVTFPDQGLLSAKHSWRYFRHSWWFLAVRSFPFSGSGGCLDSKIGTSSCTEKTWMSAGHGDLGCVLSNSGYWAWKWTSALWHYYLGLESRSGDLSMNRHVYTTWTPLSSYSGKGTEPLYCMQDRIVDRRWTAIIIPDRLDS